MSDTFGEFPETVDYGEKAADAITAAERATQEPETEQKAIQYAIAYALVDISAALTQITEILSNRANEGY